jgi:hypothetical protein
VDPRFQEPDPVDFDVKRPVETENPFTTHDKVDRINRYPRLNDEYDLPEDLKTWTLPSKHDIPSMNSLYHDILLHYQSKENTVEHITDKPSDCTWIIRRFVIKKWISYINHLHTCFWHCRGELFSAPDEDGIGTKYSPIWVGASWALICLSLPFNLILTTSLKGTRMDRMDLHSPSKLGIRFRDL